MYTVRIKGGFCGAHNLRGYEGKCENLHGHNWNVEVDITKSKLDKTGMVMDFKHAKKILFDVLEGLDHKYINELPYFKTHNPTSENISKFIFDRLDKKIDGLSKVSVWETGTSCASYER